MSNQALSNPDIMNKYASDYIEKLTFLESLDATHPLFSDIYRIVSEIRSLLLTLDDYMIKNNETEKTSIFDYVAYEDLTDRLRAQRNKI